MVGTTSALPCAGTVAAEEHDERPRSAAAGEAGSTERPAGQQVVVALELGGCAADGQAVVALDQQLDGGRVGL